MNIVDRKPQTLARKVRRLGHIDLAGAGQVTVSGQYAYVGHIPTKSLLGTSIIDISEPSNPRIVAQVMLTDWESHSHKVRVAGDLMIVNHERNMTAVGRRAEELPRVRKALTEKLGREPKPTEIAERLGITEADVAEVEEQAKRGYHNGGFKIYDVSNPARPQEIVHHKTGGIGVHRFDMDAHYAYISTEMEGYVGNILVIYDISDSQRPVEVARWSMPGQHIAAGETPIWSGKRHRLHHALRFGSEMWASCWHGGFNVVDISDLKKPKTAGTHNYHPPFPEPTHTVMPLAGRAGGRRIALSIDEEDQAQNANEEEARRGRPHACIHSFDVSDLGAIKPIALFDLSELDLPWSRAGGARFGAHQFYERPTDTIVHAVWFGGGLRIIDFADPAAPREIGHFIPEPCAGKPAPQSNDVTLDERGLIYLVDRLCGFDVLEFQG